MFEVKGSRGGNARAAKLTKEQRSAIAKQAAAKRWAKKDAPTALESPKFPGMIAQTVGGYDNRVTEIRIGPIPEELVISVPSTAPDTTLIPIEIQENHCPACLNGQSLEKGEGTHIIATVEHPVTLPMAGKDTETDVPIPAAPAPPTKQAKRQAKPMPKEFKTASSFAEKRLLQFIKEKADHIGEIEKHSNAIKKCDAEISELVPIIRALGGKIDMQAGQQQSYQNPAYRPPYQPNPFDSERDGPSIDPALYTANRGPVSAMAAPIPPPELIPGVITGGTEELGYDPRA